MIENSIYQQSNVTIVAGTLVVFLKKLILRKKFLGHHGQDTGAQWTHAHLIDKG